MVSSPIRHVGIGGVGDSVIKHEVYKNEYAAAVSGVTNRHLSST